MQEDGTSATKTGGDEPVTISAPPAAAVTIDPQNPLPEPSFFWRRVIACVVAAACLGLTWHNAEALHDLGDAAGLLELAKWQIAFAGLVLTYYFIAPSAAELTAMIQSARIIRGGMEMASQAGNERHVASESRLDRRETYRQGPIREPASPDSRFSETASDGAYTGPDGHADYQDEEDAAPRGRA